MSSVLNTLFLMKSFTRKVCNLAFLSLKLKKIYQECWQGFYSTLLVLRAEYANRSTRACNDEYNSTKYSFIWLLLLQLLQISFNRSLCVWCFFLPCYQGHKKLHRQIYRRTTVQSSEYFDIAISDLPHSEYKLKIF